MTNQNKSAFEITGSLLKKLERLSLLLEMDNVDVLVSAIVFYNKCYSEILKGSKIIVKRKDGEVLDYLSVYFEPIKKQ